MNSRTTTTRSRLTKLFQRCGFFAITIVFFAPTIAHAQYVPVYDEDVYRAIRDFQSNFGQYWQNMGEWLVSNADSIRNVITAGSSQGGLMLENCPAGDANGDDMGTAGNNGNKTFAYALNTPWGIAVASTTDPLSGLSPLPAKIPDDGGPVGSQSTNPPGTGYIQRNDGMSLRCLLIRLITLNKISTQVAIHHLLKVTISDAQQAVLSRQLLNKINAANLAWAKGGVQVNSGGVYYSEPVFISNLNNSVYNRNERTLTHIVNQVGAPANDPIGSLNVCDPMDVAQQAAQNLRPLAEDSFNYTASETSCTRYVDPAGPGTVVFASENEYDMWMEDMAAPNGPGAFTGFGYMIGNPQDNELGISSIVEAEAYRRIEQGEQNYREQLIGNEGFQPTADCTDQSDDPFCLPDLTTNISPSGTNLATVVSAVESGKEQLLLSENLDEGASESAEDTSTLANTGAGGVLGYDTLPLQLSRERTNQIVQELYETMYYGYHDLDSNETDWAAGALLNIYDNMIFNVSDPGTSISDPGADESPYDLPY